MYKVIIPQPIAEEGIDVLKEAGYEVKLLDDFSVDTMLKEVVDADAILIRTAELPGEVIAAGKKLKVIGRHGVGVDNIDVQTATEKGVYVTNAPTANNNAVAEHVVGLLVPLAKNFQPGRKVLQDGLYQNRDILQGVELKGKTLAIVGLGKIGSLVARKAYRGFEMRVIGYDPFITQEQAGPEIEVIADWDEIFKQADFISLNLPLTEKTRGIVSKREFELMKDSAFLINCARGPIVDEAELIKALQEKKIAGAALDVFDPEPPVVDNPLLRMDNVIVTPHVAAHSRASMVGMAVGAAQGIVEILSDQTPTWPVNKPVVK